MSANIKKLVEQGNQFLNVANSGLDADIIDAMLTGKSFASEYDLLYEVFGYDDDSISSPDFDVSYFVSDISDNLTAMLPVWMTLS